ncbi:MAG: trypsin-like peptidase domain-containing protein [Caldilineaceae bacterium]
MSPLIRTYRIILCCLLLTTLTSIDSQPLYAQPSLSDAAKAVVRISLCDIAACKPLGSGTIIHPSGIILTAWHVISVENSLNVAYLEDLLIEITEDIYREPQARYRANVIAVNPDMDLALLRVDRDELTSQPIELNKLSSLPTIPLSTQELQGDELRILGYPSIGDTITFFAGNHSGFEEQGALLKVQDMLSPGSSGGPALVTRNNRFEVAGVVIQRRQQFSNSNITAPGVSLLRNINQLKNLKWQPRAYRVWGANAQVVNSLSDGTPMLQIQLDVHALDFIDRPVQLLAYAYDVTTQQPWIPNDASLPRSYDGQVVFQQEFRPTQFVEVSVPIRIKIPVAELGRTAESLRFRLMLWDPEQLQILWEGETWYPVQSGGQAVAFAPTLIPTATAAPTHPATPTEQPLPTATVTPLPTATNTPPPPTATATGTATFPPTATPKPTNTPTRQPTATQKPMSTPTHRPTATATSKPVNTPMRLPAPTATPKPTNTATRRPTVAPTATVESVQAPSAYLRHMHSTVVTDNFADNRYQWSEGESDDEYLIGKRIIGLGKYRWEIKARKGVFSSSTPVMAPVTDFYATVNGRVATGPTDVGVVLNFRLDDVGNHYSFMIGNERFKVVLSYNEEWITLIDWTVSKAIRPDQNKLAVQAQGNHFTFFINNQFVAEVDNDQLPRGKVGLAVELNAAGDEAIVEFDELQVSVPTYVEWPLLVTDNFASNKHEWGEGEVNSELITGKRTFNFFGKYRWEMAAEQGVSSRSIPDLTSLTDFYMSVEAQLISGPDDADLSVAFRCDDNSNCYYFSIDNSQRFAVELLSNDTWTTLMDWTTNQAILPGKVNRLAVQAQGQHFAFFVNDQFVGDIRDNRRSEGKVALAIALYNAGDEAVFEFDNFKVRAPLPDDRTPIHVERFTAIEHGWDVGDTEDEYVKARQLFRFGKYRWETMAKQGFLWRSMPDIDPISDFYATMDGQIINGPNDVSMDLVFRYDDEGNYYVFGINNAQQFSVYLWHNKEWTTLIGWTTSSAIQPGEMNKLTVLAQGTHFTFFVNDKFVADLIDTQLLSGQVGIAVELNNAGDEAVFEFDNFELYSLPTTQ